MKQEEEGYLDVSVCPTKLPPAQLSVMPEGLSSHQVRPHLWLQQTLSCLQMPPLLSHSLHSLALSFLQVLRRLILNSILQSESSYLKSLHRIVQVRHTQAHRNLLVLQLHIKHTHPKFLSDCRLS